MITNRHSRLEEKTMRILLLLMGLLAGTFQALATPLTIQITKGVDKGLPIAVVPFGWMGGGTLPELDIAGVVRADLERSGRFENLAVKDMLAFPKSSEEVNYKDWRTLNRDNMVVGQVAAVPGGYEIRFQLLDVVRQEQLAGYKMNSTARDLRATAHRIADIIYEKLTGQRGAFATRVAYITTTGRAPNRETALNVADADGYNSQTVIASKEPIMSPAWSPDGSKLAYVSFENKQPAIFVQEIYTGRRSKLASYPGINGAPAWSPDGRRLALTLSKDGNPDIFVTDINGGGLTPLTRHSAIDTEPAWSPDGRWVYFTSDRAGRPQIYRVAAGGGEPERITFEGSYNARPSISPDGGLLTMVSLVGGNYRIAVMDLGNRSVRVLSDGNLDESPSFAPNGSMIIYATKVNGKGELAAVSVDGRIRQRLALQAGDVREPIWSPYSKAQ
jgi:TolB protein